MNRIEIWPPDYKGWSIKVQPHDVERLKAKGWRTEPPVKIDEDYSQEVTEDGNDTR